jgi:hypothetical protein
MRRQPMHSAAGVPYENLASSRFTQIYINTERKARGQVVYCR